MYRPSDGQHGQGPYQQVSGQVPIHQYSSSDTPVTTPRDTERFLPSPESTYSERFGDNNGQGRRPVSYANHPPPAQPTHLSPHYTSPQLQGEEWTSTSAKPTAHETHVEEMVNLSPAGDRDNGIPRTYDRGMHGPDTDRFSYMGGGGESINVAPSFDLRGQDVCKSREGIVQRRSSPVATIIIFLSVYSTVMSGLWFAVSVAQPRYGSAISARGTLSPESASILTTFIAKTIEMSFIAVFVAFTGQALSRRAISRGSLGVTISEVTMRNWLTQPGTMLTHSEVLRYAGGTTLGIIVLMATFVTTFYITASDALVKPNLLYGPWEHKMLTGFVRTDYANAEYIKATCPTVHAGIDAKEATSSCNALHYSGDSWHNLISFMDKWNTFANQTGGSVAQKDRPTGTTLINNTITLNGTWIETENSDVAANTAKFGRIVNNVTMAMPHAGVFSAATDRDLNHILQPDDLNGVGEYTVQASVVSPVVNVLCVNMRPEEIKPIVYVEWPNPLWINASATPKQLNLENWTTTIPPYPSWGNKTAVDDIFQWGEKYNRRPPLFQLKPKVLNTATYSVPFHSYSSPGVPFEDAVYLMGKGNKTADYTVCQLRSWVTTKCSTDFFMSGIAGGTLRAHCEDPNDPNRYSAKFSEASSPPAKGWRAVADVWLLTSGLQAANADAAGARSVSLGALAEPQLDPKLPSMAETLAVIAGVTLFKSALSSTFHTNFKHNEAELNDAKFHPGEGFTETFDSSIRQQQYTSSFNDRWKGIFYVILAFVFLINVFCLQYFLRNKGFLTDFTEPANIFTLAINSPSSHQLSGACGGGPKERDLVVPFRVSHDEATGHFFWQEANEKPWRGKYRNTFASGFDPLLDESGKIKMSYRRLSSRKNWL